MYSKVTTYSKYIVILFFILLSCKVNQSKVSANKDKVSILTSPSGTTYNHYRGLYIDSVSYILGDTLKENNLLRWCRQHQITTLSYYDLHKVMSSKKSAHLASFLKRARTHYGIKENTAILGSDASITSYLDTFNRSKVDTLQRFNAINLEREWWNGHGSFKTYSSILAKLRQWAQTQQPIVKTEEYIGWFKNSAEKELYMANVLVKNSDRILVHDYQRIPSFNYLLSRLIYLGQAAESQKRVFPVVIIFSAEPKFSQNYFRTHNFDKAYEAIVNGYLSADFSGKQYIKLIGYQLFDYSYAKTARPLVYVK